jgi:Leucine-rich repeat (LRR) protein
MEGGFPDLIETPQLQTLEISSNHFVGDFPDVSNCKKLQILVASNNNFTGEYPSDIGSLQSLQKLWLFNNQFDKPQIPTSWSGLVSIQDLQLNGVSGELPSYIGQSWTNLVHLVIINGELTGEFDTGICNCQQLQDLRLFGNRLSGELPLCICVSRTIQIFEISDNQLTGSIPYCIGSISGLTTFYLSRNNLTGTLPVSIGSLSKLEIMDLSSNAITGTVPSSFAGLTEVVGFSLCYNKLYELENGLEPLYDRIKGYSCELYNNPWSCPLPSNVPASCGAECSKCNTGSQHTDCSDCVGDANCGWCSEGPNCLEGTSSGPYAYQCKPGDWQFGTC